MTLGITRAALLALTLLLSACERPGAVAAPPSAPPSPLVASSPNASGSVRGGTFRWAVQEPAAILPHGARDHGGAAVVDALFDSLTAYDADGNVIPAAAASWTADGDASRWRFSLRAGAAFHDGRPVTAPAFVRAWDTLARDEAMRHLLRPIAGWQEVADGAAAHLSGVRAVDELTLEVTLSRPDAELPARMAHPALAPLPAVPDEEHEAFARQPIGNGPYRAAQAWARGRFLRLTRDEGWINGPLLPSAPGADPVGPAHTAHARPAFSELLFLFLDPDAAYVAFQQGRVDLTTLPPGALDTAIARYGKSLDGYRGPGVLTGPAPVLYHLAFDVRTPPFDQVEVRRALSQAIDRRSLAADVLEGNVDPVSDLVPAAIDGDRRPCGACGYNAPAARRTFAEHGIDRIELTVSTGGGHEVVAARIADDLAAVGVTVQIRSLEYDDFAAATATGGAGLFRSGWSAEHLVPGEVLWPILHAPDDRAASGTTVNTGGYQAPDVDGLLEQARGTLDAAERERRYEEAESLALERDVPVVPLFSYRLRMVASDRIAGLVVSPFGTVELTSLRPAPSTP